MLCDFIIAADTAKFGRPEITLGVMPGMGGGRRLTRFRGRVQGDGYVLDRTDDGRGRGRAVGLGEWRGFRLADSDGGSDEIGQPRSPNSLFPSLMMTKEAVNRAYEPALAEIRASGLFHAMFATEDQKGGIRSLCRRSGSLFFKDK